MNPFFALREWLVAARTPVFRSGVPAGATLARCTLTEWGEADGSLVDSFAMARGPEHPGDPQKWAQAVFGTPPAWVAAALALRQALVVFVGIERGSARSFETRERTDDEVLLGEDAGHLRFRASILVEPAVVTLTTVATPTNRRGRAYLAVVRRVHPSVIRAMLRRAGVALADGRAISGDSGCAGTI